MYQKMMQDAKKHLKRMFRFIIVPCFCVFLVLFALEFALRIFNVQDSDGWLYVICFVIALIILFVVIKILLLPSVAKKYFKSIKEGDKNE